MEADFGGENRSTRWQELSFAIVGLGLIGGSYAKALRKLGVKQIIGIEPVSYTHLTLPTNSRV